MFSIAGGSGGAKSNKAMVDWMESEGVTDDFLKGIDWNTFDRSTADQETLDRFERQVARFLMQHDKEELYEEAGARDIMLYPVHTPGEILENTQLKHRNFWVRIEHEELQDTITYPGAFAVSTENLCTVSHRAPLIGEHNEEIYMGELGLTREEMVSLMERGVI
jgi:crotonobetainyl-CoA:carnitine CoA-transferase CaiB-like acyl-CoA transferase